ncbi:hypothetical protein E6C27_scaffold316G00430 [Cucumis melo var. makuwa]|uniref:Uncharacterized protein n=1 Tax=Cucumis melo var. makuwa TaxID=1194695 RepID=A0A5A7TT31_CUCMM|nr:hypothetical protein E6C27_scaffold316G00430 [Cucumis melo var. makuwa]
MQRTSYIIGGQSREEVTRFLEYISKSFGLDCVKVHQLQTLIYYEADQSQYHAAAVTDQNAMDTEDWLGVGRLDIGEDGQTARRHTHLAMTTWGRHVWCVWLISCTRRCGWLQGCLNYSPAASKAVEKFFHDSDDGGGCLLVNLYLDTTSSSNTVFVAKLWSSLSCLTSLIFKEPTSSSPNNSTYVVFLENYPVSIVFGC